ncbi:DUF2911 domain-containing protein [Leeuwenhoekiella nanhaiensis]|uniref:Asparagine synthetase B n=1 Tax=Leeuwenhoekiella nanhaiensis TaxID=1655491 RepID=A0A2G1VMH4_9FLAO|nr:DUF2911 domain-containing protein [Leeuwenhoekiella nanhaiensis]PHQ27934.1 hypothetical protein CJ305_17550 [Leeuwenhoekiella nanhaiensis]
MKDCIILLCIILLASCKETSKEAQELPITEKTEQNSTNAVPANKKPLSPHTSAMAMVGDAHIHIDYSSPGVRKRIIFGGLLPYDTVWQAGAHMATWMETNKDLTIDGKELKAGKYGFFVIPNQEEWTIIFNTNWNQHGKDEYDEKDDVLRFKVTPKISEEIKEHLEYNVTKTTNDSGTISLSWEKVLVEFPFEVK